MSGRPHSNPWTSLFESGLNFHFSVNTVVNENPSERCCSSPA